MHLRTELTDEQKVVEPRNGDSHLTFIGAGMRNCVTYETRPDAPVYFIELDGKAKRRTRKTTVVAYDHDESWRTPVIIPVSKHPIDSINLADPRLGLLEQVNELLANTGVERARVDLARSDRAQRRPDGQRIRDAADAARSRRCAQEPAALRADQGADMINDPRAIPGKTLNYAKYDVVRVLNSLMEALRLDQSSFERLVAKVMSLPARRFLRSRRVSFLAARDGDHPGARVLRGTYQSPILVQWQPAEHQERRIDISIVQLS